MYIGRVLRSIVLPTYRYVVSIPSSTCNKDSMVPDVYMAVYGTVGMEDSRLHKAGTVNA
jgi:hypothetical protein